MTGGWGSLDAKQRHHPGFRPQICQELAAIKPGQALPSIRPDKRGVQDLSLAFGNAGGLVGEMLLLARFGTGRQIKPMQVADAQFSQPGL